MADIRMGRVELSRLGAGSNGIIQDGKWEVSEGETSGVNKHRIYMDWVNGPISWGNVIFEAETAGYSRRRENRQNE